MNEFRATHAITANDGTEVPVMFDDGVLYTREEWESGTAADWEFSPDYGLRFKGDVVEGVSFRSLVGGD